MSRSPIPMRVSFYLKPYYSFGHLCFCCACTWQLGLLPTFHILGLVISNLEEQRFLQAGHMAASLQKAGQDGERCFCCNKLPVLLGLRQVFIGLHSQVGTKMKYGTFPSFFFILFFFLFNGLDGLLESTSGWPAPSFQSVDLQAPV